VDELIGLALLVGLGYLVLKTPVGTEADAVYWYTLGRVDTRYTSLAIQHLQTIQQIAQRQHDATVYGLAAQYLQRLQGGTTAGTGT